ncbi:hypothetical protein [Saccharibacter floricola]|uniref:Lipoprotein n=1 Tax=Saccharibacter floricola DSM 15669 TaxID=1123227 RepID=A0ABQ0P0C6_9PROT|nr:hypothetical protein [Saccharibacter floricola]GBQ07842.1 hypothetical protein AA15669_1559 [Saccharibacter floricola DSM 15669]
MKLVVLCVALLSLVGCTPTRYKPLCPPLVHYTTQEQKQAADELRTHPDLHELPVMMRDYGNERREMRTSTR